MEDRRTQRTRKMLESALIALIEEEGYDNITVQHITDRANIGRATFYLHYKDKEQLLLTTLQSLLDDLDQQLSPLTFQDLATDNPRLTVTVFQHIANHSNLYRVLLSERGAAFVKHSLLTYVARQAERYGVIGLLSTVQQPIIPLSFLAEHVGATLLTAIAWWLRHGQDKTPEEMGWIVHKLIRSGVASMFEISPANLPST